MKTTVLHIPYDEEKLEALSDYMTDKNVSVESEMAEYLSKLYEKYVPATVREYIQKRQSKARPTPPKKAASAKSSPQTAAENR